MMTRKQEVEMIMQAAYNTICNRQYQIKPVTIKGRKFLIVINAALAKKVKEGIT